MSDLYQEIVKKVQESSDEELLDYFKEFQIPTNKEELYEKLINTYNDLAVGDELFNQYIKKGYQYPYPTYMIDEIILEFAKRMNFSFMHYGIWSQKYQENKEKTLMDRKAEIDEFLVMAKQHHVIDLNQLIMEIEDGSFVLEAIFLLLEKANQKPIRQDHMMQKKVYETFQKFMLQFTKIQEGLEEELYFSAFPLIYDINEKEAQRIVSNMLQLSETPVVWLLHYLQHATGKNRSYVISWCKKKMNHYSLTKEEKKQISKYQ